MNLPQRKSPRAQWHSYEEATYFVTVCTSEMRHYFGEIVKGEMKYSILGDFLCKVIAEIKQHYPETEIHEWVVMPNHFHLLLTIGGLTPDLFVVNHGETESVQRKFTQKNSKRDKLSVIIGSTKAALSRFSNRENIAFGWQTRYHDHIVRTWLECSNIIDYIKNNPIRWDSDCFNK